MKEGNTGFYIPACVIAQTPLKEKYFFVSCACKLKTHMFKSLRIPVESKF